MPAQGVAEEDADCAIGGDRDVRVAALAGCIAEHLLLRPGDAVIFGVGREERGAAIAGSDPGCPESRVAIGGDRVEAHSAGSGRAEVGTGSPGFTGIEGTPGAQRVWAVLLTGGADSSSDDDG